jgi:hypothetical protein
VRGQRARKGVSARSEIQADVKLQEATSNIFILRKVDSSSELTSMIGYQTQGSFSYALAKGDIKASLVVESQSSERSIGYVSYSQIVSRIARAMNPVMNADYSYERCGDKYVSEVSYGAELIVKINFMFTSNKFKRKFEASGGGGYGSVGEIKASLVSLDESVKNNGSLSFSVEARGTNLRADAQILQGKKIASCSLANFQECLDILDRITAYQLDELPAQAAASTTVIAHELLEYPGIAAKFDAGLVEKRLQIQNLLEGAAKDLIRAQTLVASHVFDGHDLAELQGIEETVRQNKERIRGEMVICFDDPERCNERPNIVGYNRDALSLREKTHTFELSHDESGVTGCEGRTRESLDSQCRAKAESMVGDVLEVEVQEIEFSKNKELSNSENGYRGRKCHTIVSHATCSMRVRY